MSAEYERALVDIAEFASHVQDEGGEVGKDHWDEHLHDRAVEGGHNHCGPCMALRALGAMQQFDGSEGAP